jgi:hypothetical protein
LQKALTKLAEADEARPLVELVLVMAHWQAGHPDAARELFAKTIARLDRAGLNHPEYRALRNEGAALLKVDAGPAADKPLPW